MCTAQCTAAPHRTAPHCTALQHDATAQHGTAPHRTAPHRTTLHRTHACAHARTHARTHANTHPVITEVDSCARLIAAAARLRGATTKIVAGKIHSISNTRLAFFVAVQTVRLVVALALGYGAFASARGSSLRTYQPPTLAGGTRFLTITIPLGEIILNSVALEECGCLLLCVLAVANACLQSRL